MASLDMSANLTQRTALEILLLGDDHRQISESVITASSDDIFSACAASMLKGDFEEVLLGDVAMEIFASGEEDLGNAPDVVQFIQRRVRSYLQKNEPDADNLREQCVMCIGVACLQLFIICNWTGPPCKMKPTDILPRSLSQEPNAKEFRDFAMSALSPDEDSCIYSLVTHPEFLLMADCILHRCKEYISTCLTADWWCMRCLWLQQQTLEETSPHIHEELHKLMRSISQSAILMSGEKCGDLPVAFHLECSQICLYYYEYNEARKHLQSAKAITGLDVSLSGALGKRTRFQETDKAQLFLHVQREMSAGSASSLASSGDHPLQVKGLPKDLSLNDDVVLDSIKFTDCDVDQLPNLSPVEQALVLTLCVERKRSRPREELLLEELKAYLAAALRMPQVWSVHTLALMTRCQVERDHGRTVERAMAQMQMLVDQFKETECAVTDRLRLLHAVCLPPKWSMESELAILLMALGVVTAALEIFIRLQLWEKVIACYKLLEKPEKAMKVIHDQLAIKETPTLWCMLGDFKKDKQYYEKAWELSGQRSARAMRSLGLYYLEQEEWDKSLECLEISLQKNSVQYDAWFWLGYSAEKAEKHETAVRAYRKCVTLESDSGKAWNNLSSALIKLNQKSKAFKTLQEAIRCMYDNWRIWENFMLVSVDVGEFSEAIKAFHRLLDLKEKYVEEDVLGILVKAVTENLTDAHGNQAGRLKGRLAELFGRLTSQVTSNARVWTLYAKLHGDAVTDNAVDNDKALQCLQRAHRIQMQRDGWSQEVQSCQDMLTQSINLAKAYEHCSSSKTNTMEAVQLLSSAKLMLKSVISKIKQQHQEDSATRIDLADPLASAESQLDGVVHVIAQRKEQK